MSPTAAPPRPARSRTAPPWAARTRPARTRPGIRRAPAPRPGPHARPPARVRVEPRLAERRVAVTREAGRRRLHRVLVVLGILGVVTAAVGIVLSPLLDVDEIEVRGVTGAHRAQVVALTDTERDSPLALLDTGAVEARLEGLVWVEDARVTKHFPGGLAVQIVERAPVGWLPRPDGTADLLDRRGVRLATAATPPPGVPLLQPQGAHGRTDAAQVAGALPAALRSTVQRVVVAHGQAVVVLADGVQLRLGAAVDVQEKVRAAAAVIAALDGARVSYVDVRVPSAPVTG